jgi:hypothetical protein
MARAGFRPGGAHDEDVARWIRARSVGGMAREAV